MRSFAQALGANNDNRTFFITAKIEIMAQIICYPYKKLQSCNIGDTVLAPTVNGTYDIGHDVKYHLGSVTTLTPDGNYTVSGLSGEYHASELISATITA